MTEQFSPIRPKPVPLSHGAPDKPRVTGRGASLITWGLGAALAVGVLVLVFFVVPAWLETARDAPVARHSATADGAASPPAAAPATAQPPAAAADDDDALPPYQQLKREQAREKAQKELARFVELQIQLEQKMQVGAWGADEYTAAKDLATRGDQQFVAEQFEASIASYQAAAAKLAALIERGRALLEESLADGTAAITARDKARADEAFAIAETIAPDDPRVAAGKARAALLPRINTLMRQGRNQELSGDWTAAAATYQEVQSLDPATNGLEAALARVAEGRRQAQVQEYLSAAFTHLDAGRFADARAAFQQALKLDPGNSVAKGGLEQVTKQSDIARINALKAQAEAAAAAERWGEAAELYGKVLAVDPTIQFAQDGRAVAAAQQRIGGALANIIQHPDRLSSDELYRQAQEILAEAETLEPRGPELVRRIEDVSEILEVYSQPVAVLLRSDNQTEVTLSTVGELGSFEEKRVELRPGAYTVIGSRDGCRDVREEIVVRPNMNPVDIRCVEAL